MVDSHKSYSQKCEWRTLIDFHELKGVSKKSEVEKGFWRRSMWYGQLGEKSDFQLETTTNWRQKIRESSKFCVKLTIMFTLVSIPTNF